MKVIALGFDNFVPSDRIIAVLDKNASSVKSLIDKAKMDGKLLNVSGGKKVRAVVLTSEGFVLLSFLRQKTIAERYKAAEPNAEVISIGFENYIPADKVSSLHKIHSRPIKEYIKEARKREPTKIIDGTKGNITKTLIVINGGFLIFSHLIPSTLAKRLNNE